MRPCDGDNNDIHLMVLSHPRGFCQLVEGTPNKCESFARLDVILDEDKRDLRFLHQQDHGGFPRHKKKISLVIFFIS